MRDDFAFGDEVGAVHDVQGFANIMVGDDSGLAIIITDHNVRETLNIVDRAYLISEGKVVTQGDKDFLVNDPVARKIYLGATFSM